MRITNQMIQNTSMFNINKNKIELDKAQKQITTGKRISRPSEDPIIAMRSLKYSTVLSKIDQYLNRNIQDAKSWLDVTESSLAKATNVISGLIEKTNQGNNGYLTSDDFSVVLENMSSMVDEFYSIADNDYSGRYIFSGFRTDTPVTFTKETNQNYKIDEKNLEIGSYSYPDYTDMSNFKMYELDRIKLSYDEIDNKNIEIKTDNDSINVSSLNKDDAYKMISQANDNGEEKAVFIKETGEILCSKKMKSKLENGFSVSYEKTNWKDDDLRPEHYFDYESNGIKYNKTKQEIKYDIGYSQSIRINTNAEDVFSHDMKNIIKDLKNKLLSLKDVEKLKNSDKYSQDKIEIDKAYDYIKKDLENMMKNSLSGFQKQLDNLNVTTTDIGTTYNRIELIENRLKDQYATFEKLKSENEDIDLAEAATNLTNVKNAYEASLLATSKIAGMSLLDFLR